MSQDGTQGFWKNKYIADLGEWGVLVDVNSPYDEIKKLHAQEKAKRKEAGSEFPEVPHLNAGPMSQEDLKKVAAMVLEQMDAKKSKEPVEYQQQSWLTPEQLKEMLMSVKDGNTNSKGQIRPGYIAPDDRIPTQKFFAPYVRYYITEKYNGAYAEALPLGMEDMLRFTPSFGFTVKTGDSMGRKFVSIMEVNSLSVYKWITGQDLEGNKVGEPHPDFGRMFYKSVNRAIDATDNSIWAQTFKKHEQLLGARKYSDLMALATQHNIATTHEWGPEQYRAAIAEKLADIEISNLKSKQDESYRQRQAEALLLSREGHQVAMPA